MKSKKDKQHEITLSQRGEGPTAVDNEKKKKLLLLLQAFIHLELLLLVVAPWNSWKKKLVKRKKKVLKVTLFSSLFKIFEKKMDNQTSLMKSKNFEVNIFLKKLHF